MREQGIITGNVKTIAYKKQAYIYQILLIALKEEDRHKVYH